MQKTADLNEKTDRSGRKWDAEATRTAILSAATEEFAHKGLAGARVADIAAKTNASKHMIYYHFGNKDGLYEAVLERAYAEFRLAEGAEDYNNLTPSAALAALIGATFDIHANQPHLVRIIMGENLNLGKHIQKLNCFDQRQTALETLSAILKRGEQEGTFLSDLDPLQIHLSISALCFHFIANHHTFGHVFAYDAASDENMARRKAEICEMIIRRCKT